MDDREWDIFMMEVEAQNEALIEEFMLSKMRPRDLEALLQAKQPQPDANQLAEAEELTFNA